MPSSGESAYSRVSFDGPVLLISKYALVEPEPEGAATMRASTNVVAETEALNVTFVTDDSGRPWHVDTPVDGWRTHIADLTAEPDPHAAALAWMDQDMARPVDLTRGPVFGHALFKTGQDQHVWYHRVHHIALDGFGLSLVARRVAQVYTALMADEPVLDSGFGPLESVRAEELAYRQSRRHAKDRAYWSDRYADRPPVAGPAGRSALPARTFHRHVTDLDSARTATLRTVARDVSVTWSEVLLAVTVAHLHRVTGAPETVLSLPAMGRLGSVSLRVPCMVRNILPLRVPVTYDDTVRDLAVRVSRELRAGLPHQRYRYEQLRRDLKLVGGQRRLSGPGVNIMPFEYDLRFAGHRSTVHNVSAGPVDDLAVNVYDRSDGTGLRVALDANPDVYTASELAGLQEGLLTLLDAAVTAPDRPLRELPGAPAAEPVPVSVSVSVLDGGPLPAPARPVLSLIADHAARRGAAVAVEHAGDSITYAQLFGAARDTARRLAARGVGRGDVVAVALPRGIDVAYVLHTSGSTGRPKGVAIGHGALAHFVAAATHRYGLQLQDRVLQFAPLHFDASVEEVFLTLCAGGTLVIRADDMTESVPRFLEECARLRVSVLDLPTAYWHELAYAVSTGAAALPESVRTVVIGGEAALTERVERWRKAVGTSVRLLNTYGPTEATVVATAADLHDPDLTPGDVPIGLPLPGTRAAVVDGELFLLGDALADGYRGDLLDDSRFAPLTALPDAPRAYRTGDLVPVGEDGQLRFLGRADDEFKISGHRVQPAEVESALLTHPRIREAAVVGQTLPDGTRRLVAHLVAASSAPSASEVREHLRALLPAAMIPSGVEFLDRLPRTGSGKIDRSALSVRKAPQVPTTGGPLERTVTGIWRQILGVDTIAVDDDVFDLGAQSLQAIQAANRLGVELGRDIRVAWLFQYPTAAGLARFLGEEAQPPSTPTGLPPALLADAVLDPGIRPGISRAPHDAPRRILLTGATGFVGAHLLAELLAGTAAGIVCPVRAGGRAEATARLHQALDQHGIALDERAHHRVTVLPADLAHPDFGLSRDTLCDLAATCDAIFHSAATVSIMREYATLRAANTESTRHLLRLAAVRTTPLHYVSTLSVAPPASHSPEVPEAFLPPHEGLRYGYQQSKWASERLLEQAAERGLPVTVHRLGRVVGPAGTGYVNERDFLWSVLRAGIPAGIVPDLFEDEVWTPVDFVARSLVHLCLTPNRPAGPVFHHATLPRVRLGDVYDWVEEYGYPVRRLPLEQWRELLPRSADVATTTLAFFDSADEAAPTELRLGRVHAGHVRTGLEGSGITCPPVDRELVLRHLDHCVSAGVLPAPARRQPDPATPAK